MNETTDYQESCLKNFFILDKNELDGGGLRCLGNWGTGGLFAGGDVALCSTGSRLCT